MGLIDRFKRGGSGFLHNVDGLIVDLSFTDAPDFGNGEREPKEDAFRALWAKLTVRQDSADADQVTHLFAGNADSFVISEDGRSITPVQTGKIDLFGAFTTFFESFVRNGGVDISDDVLASGGAMDFSPMVGARVRFEQVKDETTMKRSAKNYRKSSGKINELGQKKGKDGKFYDQRTPTISQVYSLGNAVGNGAVAAVSVPVKAGAAKRATKAVVAAVEDISEFATETLLNILQGEKSKAIAKGGLNLAVTRTLTGDERRDAVRKYLFDDSNLDQIAAEGLITFEKSGKQMIALA